MQRHPRDRQSVARQLPVPATNATPDFLPHAIWDSDIVPLDLKSDVLQMVLS